MALVLQDRSQVAYRSELKFDPPTGPVVGSGTARAKSDRTFARLDLTYQNPNGILY